MRLVSAAARPFSVASLAVFLIASGSGAARAQGAAPTLKVYHLDVGQGDATLIVGPTGTTCLVDGGDAGQGNAVVVPQLLALGVATLDVTVASHWHADHFAGLAETAVAGFLPTVAYDRGLDGSLNGQFHYSAYQAAMASRRATLAPGTVIDLGGGASLTCVAANGATATGAAVALAGTAQPENNRSIVLRLAYGNYQEALGGDLQGGFNGTADVETAVAAAMGDVDVYKVHHHGSDTSTNGFWLGVLRPETAIVSCGDGNPYGHPHAAVVNGLLAAPELAALYRLNLCNPSTLTPGDPRQIASTGTLLVETDGASYAISGPGAPATTRPVDDAATAPDWAPLDVVISELMINPKGPSGQPVQDVDGEWVELRNNRPHPVNLLGFTLRDQGLDAFTLPSTPLAPQGRLLVGRSANAALNGGIVPDVVAPANELVLANGSDELELVAPGGLVIDAVAWG
ncbi:MAG TPA: lamin tail domain-containing protein, partial [Planctomycetota bacterium]|nr:lamin tail domain-containing protein [Planctomycetota bacterium]